MIKTESREIDGHLISVTQFPGTEGVKILTKLTGIIGPSFGAVIGSIPNLETPIDSKGLNEALESLFSKLDEVSTDQLIKRLLRDTRIDGKEVLPMFDMTFGGNYRLLLSTLKFVLEVNYSDFFGGFLEKVREGMRKFQLPSPGLTPEQ